MERENIVMNKAYKFAVKIINLYKSIVDINKEYVLSKQLLRSGTSIGANIRESENAQSKKDFASKLNIALKEAGETEYWLDLLKDTEYIDRIKHEEYSRDIQEIIRLLTSITKKMKDKYE